MARPAATRPGNSGQAVNVSIIIPCLNEERNIRPCLESLASQDYPGDFEIIVVDNGSDDKTREIVGDLSNSHPRIRLVLEPEKGTASARNAGVRSAAHDFLAFVDADCESPGGWLSTLVRGYEAAKIRDPGIIAVGGRNIAPGDAGPFVRAIEIALDSYIGSYVSIQGRQYPRAVLVSNLSMSNALFEKEKIVEVGGFDESLRSEAEDADINFRLAEAGYRFLFIPESFVWHRLRSSPRLWLKNMFRYGKGRTRLLKRHPKMWTVHFALPLVFILAMGSIPLALLSKLFLLPLVYFPLIFCLSLIQAARKSEPSLFGRVAAAYVLLHFGYAAGELYGLLNPKVR